MTPRLRYVRDMVELGCGGAEAQGGAGGARRRPGGRRRVTHGDPPDAAPLAAALCGARPEGLADKSSRPDGCAHQTTPAVEARVVEMRRAHPGWGRRTLRTHLEREGVTPLPDRSSVHRALVPGHQSWRNGMRDGGITHGQPRPFSGGPWRPPPSNTGWAARRAVPSGRGKRDAKLTRAQHHNACGPRRAVRSRWRAGKPGRHLRFRFVRCRMAGRCLMSRPIARGRVG